MSDGTGSEKSRTFFGSISLSIDPALEVVSPVAALALAEWDRLRGGRTMPAPSDVDPLALPRRLLPYILLLDIEHQPALRFRWRLIGTHITGVVDRDRTGRYWDEIYDRRTFAVLSTGPLWVLEHKRPLRVLGNAHYAGKDHIRSESVDMPLSNDGVTVHRILTVTVYDLEH